MRGTAILPPSFQAIGDEIAGVTGSAEDDAQLPGVDLQDARRREHGVGVHVVVRGPHCLTPPGHAAARELADLHLGFGVKRHAERQLVSGGLGMDLLQMLENGVGLGIFFCGLVLRTRRSR